MPERFEIDSPAAACLREIKEETGITPEQIVSLDLRVFALLKDGDELHGVYYFSGELKEKPPLTETDEGELHWVKIPDGRNLPMAEHIKSFYLHWSQNMEDKELKCFLDEGITLL